MATIIIGNGFDLRCGLPSSYQEFFEYQKKNNGNYTSFFDCVRRFGNLDRPSAPDVVSVNDALSKRDCGFDAVSKDFERFTLWDALFALLSLTPKRTEPIVNWYDVENVMKRSLYLDKKNTKDVPDEPPFFRWQNVLGMLAKRKANARFSKKSEKISMDLYSDLEAIVADFICESSINISRNYVLLTGREVKGKVKNFFESETLHILLSELRQYERRFSKYIQNAATMNPGYKAKAEGLADFLGGMAVDPRDPTRYLGDSSLSIVSFNYTSFRDNMHHIHGCCLDDDALFGIYLNGADDEDPLYPFTKSARRSALAVVHRQDLSWPDFAGGRVAVFGHSLCEQDYSFFFGMLDRLDVLSDVGVRPHITFVCSAHGEVTLEGCMEETRRSLERLLWEYSRARDRKGENLFESLCLNRNVIEIMPLLKTNP